MLITNSGLQPAEISYRLHFSRHGNGAIAFVATVLAFCIFCAGDCCFANSLTTQQMRDHDAFAVLGKEVFRNQFERDSRSSLDPLFNAPTAPRTEINALVGTIVGAASWYNPRSESGDTETSSGEPYDPDKWTAAIQIDLRAQFGGVAYGKNYRVAYTLVESGNKRVIVKINDVGPLKPGRVIDLSERAMRYFDQALLLGLLANVKVIPLPGESWTPGPVGSDLIKMQWCGPGMLDAIAGHSGYRA